MKKILVPVDFSPCAANAFHYALHLASRIGAEITALHVIFPNDGINNNMYDAFWIDDYIEQRKKDLETWTSNQVTESGFTDIKTEVICNVGFPVGTIAETATAINAAFVVMGTTGATGLKGILIGSTAGGVVVNTHIPVLTIPPEASFKPVKHFVLATDFDFRTDAKSHHVLTMLLKAHEAQLNVLHVLPENAPPPVEKEKSVSEHLIGIRHYFHYIHDNDVVNAIDNFIESTEAGVLVGVAHRHSIFHQLFTKSTARALAGRVQIPMLTLHDA